MMFRPRIVFAFTLIIGALHTPSLRSQALTLITSPGSSATLPAEPMTVPAVQAPVSFDTSTLGWQLGQLSPYSRTGLIGSSTSGNLDTANTTSQPKVNPFIGATIGMNGGLTTTKSTTTTTTSASTQFVPVILTPVASKTATTSSSGYSFGPRFLSYAPLAPDYGLIPTIDHSDGGTTGMYNQSNSSGSDISRLASVPEPGTLLLCGGLLAMISYAWARRKQNELVKPTDEKTVVTEAV